MNRMGKGGEARRKTAIVVGEFDHVHNASSHPAHRLTCSYTGAGVGGVSSAARLAKAGFKVTVVEKNDFVGGRCSLLHHEGYICNSTAYYSKSKMVC